MLLFSATITEERQSHSIASKNKFIDGIGAISRAPLFQVPPRRKRLHARVAKTKRHHERHEARLPEREAVVLRAGEKEDTGSAGVCMIEALYSPTQGGPFGYRCKLCARVTRTYRGMEMHCLRVHNLKAQGELFDGEKVQREANDEYVRACMDRGRAGTIRGSLFGKHTEDR